jgi:hypothetical protein
MPMCSFFTEDDRYSAPTLMFANVRDRAGARALAERTLRASPHHIQVEARKADVLMFTVRRADIERTLVNAG